jgi:F-type H+-transporting ATPase subunit b
VHGDAAHGDAAHDHGAHGEHHFNLWHGFLGERDDIEHPTLLYRTPGMPVPFGAYLINSGILFFLLYRFGKRPILDGLHKRRERILQGIEEASRMKADAEAALTKYQAKLDGIEADVARIRKEMRESAAVERANILAEAKKRRERMEHEARQLVVQELKAAKEELYAETVRASMATAERLLRSQLGNADHDRLGEDYLASLKSSAVNAKGGRA